MFQNQMWSQVFTCDHMWFWNMFMWNFCKGTNRQAREQVYTRQNHASCFKPAWTMLCWPAWTMLCWSAWTMLCWPRLMFFSHDNNVVSCYNIVQSMSVQCLNNTVNVGPTILFSIVSTILSNDDVVTSLVMAVGNRENKYWYLVKTYSYTTANSAIWLATLLAIYSSIDIE